MAHETTIETTTNQPWRIAGDTGVTHQAVCSCGWAGPVWSGRDERRAIRAARHHVTSLMTRDDVTVCTDCALIIANSDDSGIADPEAHHARMDEHMALIPGVWVIGSEDENPFSTRPCDACGETLAGVRHDAAVIPR